MLREKIYPLFQRPIERVTSFLAAQGISPNQLTFAGAVLSLITGVIYAKGYIFLGGIFLVIGSLADLLDGSLARLTGKASAFGGFLDSSLDRYSDFFIFSGMAVYFVNHGEIFWFLISLGILLGAFVVSYAKARAENLIKNCGIGFFGRGERIFLLAAGTLFPFLLKLVLLALFVGTHVTAIQRILHTRKALAENQKG